MLVVGTGLVGTSVALALRAKGVSVHVVDQDERLAKLAEDLERALPACLTAIRRWSLLLSLLRLSVRSLEPTLVFI